MFRVFLSSSGNFVFIETQHKEIGNALMKQSHSLIHLKLIYEDRFFLPLEILPRLSNLQKLKLINNENHDLLLEDIINEFFV